MLHAGLDLSRRKLDVCLLGDDGEHLDQLVVAPDPDSLRRLARRSAGARLLPPTTVTDSALAVIEDPQGAAFAVFEGETDP